MSGYHAERLDDPLRAVARCQARQLVDISDVTKRLIPRKPHANRAPKSTRGNNQLARYASSCDRAVIVDHQVAALGRAQLRDLVEAWTIPNTKHGLCPL